MNCKNNIFQDLRYSMLFLFLVLFGNLASAQSNEDCMMCHEDRELTTEKRGRTISMFVNIKTLGNSVHKDVDCVFCHEDADVEEFPHNETLKPVNCGNCHDVAQERFEKGIHGTLWYWFK